MGRFHAAAIAGVEEVEVVALAEPSPEALAQASAIVPGAATYPVIGDAPGPPRARGGAGRRADLAPPAHRRGRPRRPACTSCARSRSPSTSTTPAASPPSPTTRAASCRSASGAGSPRRGATAKERIDAGEIGTPVYVRLAQWDGDPPPASFCDPAVSGGLAIDCGVHEYDLAEWLTGRRITRVSAWALPLVEPSVGEAGDLDNLLAVLELDGGAVATVDLTRNARYGDDVRTEVLGSQGALLVDLLPTSHTRLGDASGVRELPESAVEDAMAAGVAAQVRAFAAARAGRGGRGARRRGQHPLERGRPGRDGRGPQPPARRPRDRYVAQATAARRRPGLHPVEEGLVRVGGDGPRPILRLAARRPHHAQQAAVGPDDAAARVPGDDVRGELEAGPEVVALAVDVAGADGDPAPDLDRRRGDRPVVREHQLDAAPDRCRRAAAAPAARARRPGGSPRRGRCRWRPPRRRGADRPA